MQKIFCKANIIIEHEAEKQTKALQSLNTDHQ